MAIKVKSEKIQKTLTCSVIEKESCPSVMLPYVDLLEYFEVKQKS